ncbi:MAG TPA: FHA domain-containing protein [Syntrophales bacterium]|nr:FHA domain-containing protein [Syntrophales bacterium]
MAMKRCDQGHYYDADKHTMCPACGVPDLEIGKTKPLGNASPQLEATWHSPALDEGKTIRHGTSRVGPLDPGKTVALVRKKAGIDPVVGWLVCVEGADKGRDYRIRSEKNFIGRSEKMDIQVSGDDTISRENQAVVSFNPKNGTFKVHPGDGRGIVYLNGADVDAPQELKPYDVIEIGQTKLTFVPFCGEKFQW